eukprot:34957_1
MVCVVMQLLILLSTALIITNGLLTDFGNWTTSTLHLPRACMSFVLGQYNQSIFILGGYDGATSHVYQLVEYDIMENVIYDHGTSVLPYSTVQGGGFYQLSDVIYILGSDAITLYTYNLRTKQYAPNWNDVNIPIDAEAKGCLVLFEGYLFILGGYNNALSSGYSDTFQAFNISSNSWISSLPSMLYKRSGPSCVVHPLSNELYAMGGWVGWPDAINQDSIEKINIGNMDNIQSESFQNVGTLLHAGSGQRCVVYKDLILVIGGAFDDQMGGVFHDEISVLNISSNRISSGGYLNTAVGNPGVVMVNNVIYVIAGQTASGSVDIIQYIDLSSPTSIPTTSHPTTSIPTTSHPTTSIPTTSHPTTSIPISNDPITMLPTISDDDDQGEDFDDTWIMKVDGLNCGDGYTDLERTSSFYGSYCERCPAGTAGTYGHCYKCGTFEEPNHNSTDCAFLHPWWLYLIETIAGLTCIGGIFVWIYQKTCKQSNDESIAANIQLQSVDKNEWICPICTFSNKSEVIQCQMCGQGMKQHADSNAKKMMVDNNKSVTPPNQNNNDIEGDESHNTTK